MLQKTKANLSSDHMPGTRMNPMPGATTEEIDAARRAWAGADPLTQEERNHMSPEEIVSFTEQIDRARNAGWAVVQASVIAGLGQVPRFVGQFHGQFLDEAGCETDAQGAWPQEHTEARAWGRILRRIS